MIPVIGVSWDFLTPRNRERILHNPPGLSCAFSICSPHKGRDRKECDILFGMFPPDLLKGAKRLKWLQTPCAGVEQFAHKELYAGPVALTNATGAYGTAISEHLLTLTLMLFRRMGEYYERQQKQQWGLIGQVRPVFGASSNGGGAWKYRLSLRQKNERLRSGCKRGPASSRGKTGLSGQTLFLSGVGSGTGRGGYCGLVPAGNPKHDRYSFCRSY